MDARPSAVSRRALLAGGATALGLLSGCSSAVFPDDTETEEPADPPLDRILVRGDTGETEPIRLTLVYAPPDGHTRRPIWTTVEAPAHGRTIAIAGALETATGFYSLTAASRRHDNHEVVSFNSRTLSDEQEVQFEVVVKNTGDVWANRNKAGREISIPDYTPSLDRGREPVK